MTNEQSGIMRGTLSKARLKLGKILKALTPTWLFRGFSRQRRGFSSSLNVCIDRRLPTNGTAPTIPASQAANRSLYSSSFPTDKETVAAPKVHRHSFSRDVISVSETGKVDEVRDEFADMTFPRTFMATSHIPEMTLTDSRSGKT